MTVEIGFDPNFRPGSGAPPDLPPERYHALVDTGALDSCIDSTLAIALRLPIVNRQQVAGVHGVGEVNAHLARIRVPELDITAYGRFAGVHLRAGGLPHNALIGRTFLRYFPMIYEGETGAVSLSRKGGPGMTAGNAE